MLKKKFREKFVQERLAKNMTHLNEKFVQERMAKNMIHLN